MEEHRTGIEERANELREQLKELKKQQEEEEKKAEEEEASLLRQRRATEEQDRKEADGDAEDSVFALMPCASLEMPIGQNVWGVRSEAMVVCIQRVLAARQQKLQLMNADPRYLPFEGQKEVASTSSFSSSDPSSFLPSPLPPFPPSFLTSSPPYFLPSLLPFHSSFCSIFLCLFIRPCSSTGQHTPLPPLPSLVLQVQQQLYELWKKSDDALNCFQRIVDLDIDVKAEQDRLYLSYYRRYVFRHFGSTHWMHTIIALGQVPADIVEILRDQCDKRKALASAQGNITQPRQLGRDQRSGDEDLGRRQQYTTTDRGPRPAPGLIRACLGLPQVPGPGSA